MSRRGFDPSAAEDDVTVVEVVGLAGRVGVLGLGEVDVQHVADAVVHMASLPLDANVLFMTVMATKMPYVGRG